MKEQKTVVVSGASRGIGRAITEKLLEEGHRVIGLARQFKEEDYEAEGFYPVTIDLSETKKIPALAKALIKEHKQIDALICNAGRGLFGKLEELSFDEIEQLVNLNFLSQVALTKAFLPLMKRQRAGRILFIGSEAALAGKKKGSVYCASKFAVRGFAQALREECATSGVGVTLINPGMVKTDFFDDLNFRPGESHDEHIIAADIAEIVSFVLSSREGSVLDEINVSPQKKQLIFG